jgi:hypothetical protein
MELFICSYCGSNRKNKNSWANHERTCPLNTNRKYKNGMLGKKGSNQYIKAEILGLEKPSYDRSHLPPAGCAAWSKEKRSQAAKDQGWGGYRENAGRSKKFKIKDSFGKEVVLQSSYELKCSEILDEMKIKWIRPSYLKYDDTRKYFPDFYLLDYDIYLDPKNSYLAQMDQDKIDKVIKTNNVKVYILTEENINREYLNMLVSPNGEGIS